MATCGESSSPGFDGRGLLAPNKSPPITHQMNVGKPCSNCRDACPGFELHYWRCKQIFNTKIERSPLNGSMLICNIVQTVKVLWIEIKLCKLINKAFKRTATPESLLVECLNSSSSAELLRTLNRVNLSCTNII
ncbi:hypothetical protein KUTeg_020084 [Tegillarca granosa]|uniref:Uncharacterized protein n=1 Tax=Tegillarca granosa TaxID=220873 RepID=A0ABQ9EB37_TEGGR|nr:hypothetical protein KUTeg_020084 [Tegillarca granosa]